MLLNSRCVIMVVEKEEQSVKRRQKLRIIVD